MSLGAAAGLHPAPTCPLALPHSPIAGQEAQAGWADLVTEDDHGQEVAVGLAVLQLNDPPLEEASCPCAHTLPAQLDTHAEVVSLLV